MSFEFLYQFAIVLVCILIGARVGGIGLGVFGDSLFRLRFKTCGFTD